MRRSGVRLPEAAQSKTAGQLRFLTKALPSPSLPSAARAPVVPPSRSAASHRLRSNQVAVEVHRHRRGRMSQHPLDDLGIGPGTEPCGRRCVAQVVYAQLGPPNRRLCRHFAVDRGGSLMQGLVALR